MSFVKGVKISEAVYEAYSLCVTERCLEGSLSIHRLTQVHVRSTVTFPRRM